MSQKPTPVNTEVAWDKTKTIMSKTDATGTIEYVNQVFKDVSGYTEEELIGKPHSVIRHPDMPKSIFKILWDNISKGINFHAIVKNMAKNGEYYWVITDFDIIKDPTGKIINYMGRRTSVPKETVENHIVPLYQKLLQVEQASGIEAGVKYFEQFLEEQGKDYLTYIEDIILKYK